MPRRQSKHPNAPKRTQHEIDRDRADISRRYLSGQSQRDIAGSLSITREMVRYDLEALAAEWRKEAAMNYTEAKDLERRKLDNLERVYWEAWERSVSQKRQKTRTSTSKPAAGKGSKGRGDMTAMVENVETFGDPRFLEGVRWCIDRRIRLFGLDAFDPGLGGNNGNTPASPAAIVRLPSFAPPRVPPVILPSTNN